MGDRKKPRLLGFNHVAIEVGNIEEALEFYGSLFAFELRSREPGMAFINLGDQFPRAPGNTRPVSDRRPPFRPCRGGQGSRALGHRGGGNQC